MTAAAQASGSTLSTALPGGEEHGSKRKLVDYQSALGNGSSPTARLLTRPIAAGVKGSYAGAALHGSSASSAPAVPAANEEPSICVQALLAGEVMLRPSRMSATPPTSSNSIPSILGTLIKTVLTYDKKLKHYAMFNSTEYEIIAAANEPYPDDLLPTRHPGRLVYIRSDLVVPKQPISASNLQVLSRKDVQKMNDLNVLIRNLPVGFGKIQYEPTGMHVKVMSSTYKSGPDDKVTFLRPVYNHGTNEHLLIPVSSLYVGESKETPILEQSVLPQGTHVRFLFSPGLVNDKTFACNLSLVTMLPADNCFGSPPKKINSITQLQPGGVSVDLHVAPFGITLRSERCELLDTHLKELTPDESIALHIHHSNTTSQDPFAVSVGELDRAFRAAGKRSWEHASLDQIVERIVNIKHTANPKLNEHKTQKKKFTIVFSLANQNQQEVVSKNIADSYNNHHHTGHSLLHPHIGVLLVLQPTSFSSKGIAKVNAAQVLSKTHCSSLRSTHTYAPGYSIPYVKDHGKVDAGDVEQVLGATLTHVSILSFADAAKSSTLKEYDIAVKGDVVYPLPLENNLISVQWKPSAGKGAPKNAISKLFADEDFLKIAKVDEPKDAGRKKKFDKVIKTVLVTPKPGFVKAVLATLLLRKDLLILPNDALDEDGCLVRSTRPYPVMAYDMLKHPSVKYIQFLSPYALRIIFADGYNYRVLPELLQLEKTVAHSDNNISLSHQAGSPWTEVITDGAHATLGHTLTPPASVCPNTYYFGGFTGYPTSQWLEKTLFNTVLGTTLKVVDSPEETEKEGVFIQYLKSSIKPRNLRSKDTTISVFSSNPTVRAMLDDMTKLIVHFSSGTLYPVTDGLQFLTVQSDAVSDAKGATMEEAALASIKPLDYEPIPDADIGLEPTDPDPPLHGSAPASQSNKEQWHDSGKGNRRSNRSNKASGAISQQPQPLNKATHNTQQPQVQKGNQYLSLSKDDDVELFDDPGVVAAAEGNSRKPDAGDFDTSKDVKITTYFNHNLTGFRPEAQIKNVTKLVVTIWAREKPSYDKRQLGVDFTGTKKLGGLLTAIGKTKYALKPVIQMLEANVRAAGGLALTTLCEKLEDYLGELMQKEKSNNNTASTHQQQKQPTQQASSSSTNSSATNSGTNTSTGKNSTNKGNKEKAGTLTSYFVPANALVEDLTNSQEDKDDTTSYEGQNDEEMKDDHKGDADDGEPQAEHGGDAKKSRPNPPSPHKAYGKSSVTSSTMAAASVALIQTLTDSTPSPEQPDEGDGTNI